MTHSPMARSPMIQGVLEFESLADVFERTWRDLKPDSSPPVFDVRFRAYAGIDSKIRFDPAAGRAEVKLSDQLEAAPRRVHEALARILVGKLLGRPAPESAARPYREFVARDDVRRRALEVRARRGRKRHAGPDGEVYQLDPLFDRLNALYFDSELDKPALGWSPTRSRRLLGHYDPAHQAIVLSRILDQRRVPEYVVEYVLYHEMLHLVFPVVHGPRRRCVHSAEFRRRERRFPRYDDAVAFLKRL